MKYPLLLILQCLSNLSALPAIIIGFKQRGILWYYAWLSFLCDITSFSLKYVFHWKHYLVSNIFLPVEFLLIGYYLIRSSWRGARWQQVLAVLCAPVLYFSIRTAIFFPKKPNLEDAAILYGLLIILCLVALYKMMMRIEHIRLEESPLFTFTAAFLVYVAGILLLILFDEHLVKNYPPQMVHQIWAMHWPLNILKNLAIARVIYLLKTRPSIDVSR